MLLSALKDAFAQVGAVCAVAFVVFLISRRSVRGFGEWLGIKVPTARSVRLALVLVVPMFGLAVLINRLPALQPFFEKATGFNAIIRDAGLPLGPTLAVALVHGLIQTGLSEEILFRGLLGHRLAQRLPFHAANLTQATLFAALHGIFPLLADVDLPLAVVVSLFLLFPFVAAWTMGWLNERHGNGSIVPGWIVHGFGNAASYMWIVVSVR